MEIHKNTRQEFVNQAETLKKLDNASNDGRGFSVVKQVIEDLEKGDPFLARIDAFQQGDKWTMAPIEVKDFLLENIFRDYRAPWELDKDNFYERLAARKEIYIDTRFDENKDTFDGVSKKLTEKGFRPYLPPISLTKTKFTNEALFVAEQEKSPEEAVGEVLELAKNSTKKNHMARVIVRTFEQGQKEAFVYFRPRVKRENIKDSFQNGIFVWTEDDGKLVAKAEINDTEGIVLTFEKNQFPSLEEKMTELGSGSNMQNEKIESDNEDYIKYKIKPSHNWNLAKRDILTVVDNWFNPYTTN